MAIDVIGRAAELRSIEEFVTRVASGPAVLVLEGDAGIGKTTLWQFGLEAADGLGVRVLSVRCVETEASLSYGGLSDLVGAEFERVAASLAPPRRRALETALLLSEPGEEAVDGRAIGLAVLDSLRLLAGTGPVVVAIDDFQWLDRSSARALELAVRRLRGERVGLFATVRTETGSGAHPGRWLSGECVSSIDVAPLSAAALHRLLDRRLALKLARPDLSRLADMTGGNPFFALEIGRELARGGRSLRRGDGLPIPVQLTALIEERLDRVGPHARRPLVAVAALDRPTVDIITSALGGVRRVAPALDAAVEEGVVVVEGSRIRFAHPLLASVCYRRTPIWCRREIHRLIADVVVDQEERTRHRALACEGPDAHVAAELDALAVVIEKRGALGSGEVLEQAAELTPEDQAPERRRRRLQAAWQYLHAGDRERATATMEQLLLEVTSGPERSDILYQLAWAQHPPELPRILARYDEALAEAAGSDLRIARILATRSGYRLNVDAGAALEDARAALDHAERLDWEPIPERVTRHDLRAPAWVLAAAIARLGYVETLTLSETPGLLERGIKIEERLTAAEAFTFWDSPAAMLGLRLWRRDHVDRARELLETKIALLASETMRASARRELAALEWLSGRWARALEHTAAVLEVAEQTQDDRLRAAGLQASALVEAHLGQVEDASTKAQEALRLSVSTSDEITAIRSHGVLGHLQLASGAYEAAARILRDLPKRLVELGWNDPIDSVWPDAIEALTACGELAGARAVLHLFEPRAARAGRRSRACAMRSRGLLVVAERDPAAALGVLESSLAELDALSSPFDHARTLLALGKARRLARRRRDAREAFERALAGFDSIGARLWAASARDELSRISGRRPTGAALTATELRIASFVADGMSNREIAAAEFLSVRTVESYLSRIYRKVGVRTRTALARRLAGPSLDHVKAPKVQ